MITFFPVRALVPASFIIFVVRMRKSKVTSEECCSVSVSLGRSLLPWTIIEVNEHTYTFEALFTSIQGGRYDAVTISEELGKILDDVSYTCGVSFSDLELTRRLKNFCLRDHKCRDPIEKLYYSCDFEPIICINCASQNVQPSAEYFPLCPDCQEQGIIPTQRPKRST